MADTHPSVQVGAITPETVTRATVDTTSSLDVSVVASTRAACAVVVVTEPTAPTFS